MDVFFIPVAGGQGVHFADSNVLFLGGGSLGRREPPNYWYLFYKHYMQEHTDILVENLNEFREYLWSNREPALYFGWWILAFIWVLAALHLARKHGRKAREIFSEFVRLHITYVSPGQWRVLFGAGRITPGYIFLTYGFAMSRNSHGIPLYLTTSAQLIISAIIVLVLWLIDRYYGGAFGGEANRTLGEDVGPLVEWCTETLAEWRADVAPSFAASALLHFSMLIAFVILPLIVGLTLWGSLQEYLMDEVCGAWSLPLWGDRVFTVFFMTAYKIPPEWLRQATRKIRPTAVQL